MGEPHHHVHVRSLRTKNNFMIVNAVAYMSLMFGPCMQDRQIHH